MKHGHAFRPVTDFETNSRLEGVITSARTVNIIC